TVKNFKESKRGTVKSVTVLVVTMLALFIGGCSTSSFKYMNDANKTNHIDSNVSDEAYAEDMEFDWKIAKGDRVEIIVVSQSANDGDQQLNQILNTGGRMQAALTRDGSDGYLMNSICSVHLPLIGTVSVKGLTENQAADKLTLEYRKYLKNPFVSVKILNQKLFVLGEVKKPGVLQVANGTMSLFEALAYAGDLTDDGDRTNLMIVRGDLRNPIVREINLADLSSLKLTSTILKPNDIIYVQPRGMKAYNVAFREQMPFFQMLNAMLLPFVNYTSIKNGDAINVYPFQ
ncbi:polysaccharide biosynthesis/export family protein, partial [Sulfuricurvum sp.]|uniref:polysaccharide biosynthesis/export family protein n=1 Tax=Sulfuricurvum sp. TaxID=2025608 RepID=UPI002639DB56